MLKAYDSSSGSKVLRFLGPIVGYDKTRNEAGGTIAFTAAGIQWRLDRRRIGKATAGATFGTSSLSLLDRGEMMGRIVDALNSGEATNIFTDAADTGIRRGTITASSSTFVGPWRYKVASEANSDLSGTLDGPDYQVRPVEPATDAIGVQLGALDVMAAIGQLQANVAFEFGGGKANVAEWHDVGDASTLCNRAISLPSGYPDNANDVPIQWDDSAAITDRGLYEDVIPGDVITSDLRTKLVQDAVRVRKIPRRVIAFTPVAEDASLSIDQRRLPRLFVDYSPGDTIRFRATETFPVRDTSGTVIGVTSVQTVDVLMRVFVAQVDIDDGGVATTSLALQSDS
jgi:hypothetical protein